MLIVPLSIILGLFLIIAIILNWWSIMIAVNTIVLFFSSMMFIVTCCVGFTEFSEIAIPCLVVMIISALILILAIVKEHKQNHREERWRH